MICGQSPHLPLLHPRKANLILDEGSISDVTCFIEDLAAHINYLHAENVQRLSKADLKMIAYYNSKRPLLEDFEENQLVLLKNT